MLVVGECGDGKSTLISSLRDPNCSGEPVCGRNPEGVTKDILLYRCPDIDGVPMNIIDTPGVGDANVTPIALIAMLETFLGSDMVPGGIRGVIVTTPIPDCRIKLGAQVVQIIVDKGFVAGDGGNKYANIILAGTKWDKAEEEDRENFMTGTDGGKSVKETFFSLATPPGQGRAVMVHKNHYTSLLRAIAALPAAAIEFKAPDTKVMAGALAEKMGMEPEAFESQLGAMREMVAAQSAQIQDLMSKMFEAEEKHREEMKERDERMLRMQEQMREDARKAEEDRKEQQRRFESLRAEERESRRQEMEMMQQQAQSQKQQQDQMMQKMREESAAAERKHQESVKQMQQANQQAMQQAREASEAAAAAAHKEEGGCFPGTATVETPQGPQPMSALRAGDCVLAVDAGGRLCFDEVYFFGHAQADACEAFVRLRTATGRELRASRTHLVPVSSPKGQDMWCRAVFVHAQAVRPGDRVFVRGPAGRAEPEQVLEVGECKDQGLFNPFTLSGTVVVDGIVASVHSEWILDDVLPSRWLHGVYQAMLLPGRALYRMAGPRAADVLEVNNPQGHRTASIGTSHRAFAFLALSLLTPAAVAAAAFGVHTMQAF